ncbi:NADPH-dependent diflavin oxidoreductase 1 [Episyrphus balteatus]|uniref:NADPH-dependent diflavin oxidoreductase 1 n=1 Tax=Episyrphus balteatus TaxID=286459 RepID=UPI002485E497|nr:NADPH-dependent diflavin oxidoreductase 1 [Episyrphus balteatus]XP_055848624.1 NADPH-dependent diflavin oxidoreductase 1 [Episyrphus balteatus]
MRLLVLYGSQTGTAQDVAEKIWRESKNYSFTGPFMSMDDYDIQNLIKEQLVVFVAATTGQGEEPDNMKKFWKFLLRKSLPTNSLQNLKFACVGLGDSSYAKYNFAAKKLNKRLIQLSASPIIPIGLCDDQHDHGMAASLLPWIQNLWTTFKQTYPYLKETISNEFCYKWTVFESSSTFNSDLSHLKWPFKEKPLNFQVIENVRTTSEDHFQDVRLIKLKFPPNSTWNPGDVLQVRPCNSDEKVDELFEILGEHNLPFNKNTVVELKQNHEDLPVPLPYQHPVTLGLLAKYVWDLTSVPRQSAFGLLALNCKDELEKEKLEEFTTSEGLEEVIAYANRPRRSILEILYDFRHATAALTLPILFELFQIIQPRSFSIASVVEEGSLNLLVAIVEYKTKLSTPRRGLCSNWLKNIVIGDEILGTIKRGTFIIPKDFSTPLIMVGPGTGIAPFLSVLMEREYSAEIPTESMVFFGCRNKDKDFFCREYFERFESKGIAKCLTAFSRDQENKIYVQHLIKDYSSSIRDLILNKNAIILVAGSSNNMPKSVKEAFTEVLEDELFIEKMIKTNRYQEETWS